MIHGATTVTRARAAGRAGRSHHAAPAAVHPGAGPPIGPRGEPRALDRDPRARPGCL